MYQNDRCFYDIILTVFKDSIENAKKKDGYNRYSIKLTYEYL